MPRRAAQQSRFAGCAIIEGWWAAFRPTVHELWRRGEKNCRAEAGRGATAGSRSYLRVTVALGLVLASVITAPGHADDGRSGDSCDGTADGASYAEAQGSVSNGTVTLLNRSIVVVGPDTTSDAGQQRYASADVTPNMGGHTSAAIVLVAHHLALLRGLGQTSPSSAVEQRPRRSTAFDQKQRSVELSQIAVKANRMRHHGNLALRRPSS